jgi:single-stranded-DNA-specific exonuclease
MNTRWVLEEPITDEIKQRFPEVGPVLLQLLWNRGVRTRGEMDVYLGPDWSRDTYSPSLFLNMPRAVARVFEALKSGEVIVVHGDYDADGVCGSAVMIATLRDIGRALCFENLVISYIPHREKEGYGMSVETVEHLHSHDKCGLIITVDCGISNKSAIDRARELGIDTIVCDHHTMPDDIPTDAILIHPLVPGETYPNKQLCGTGVAFKFASALLEEARQRGGLLSDGHEKWLLDLVAIATVTDVVPLVGENRVLERYGLLVLNKTRRKGIQKLLDVAGSKVGALDTVSIGFQIGPRLNAAGRMAHASAALDLLLEEDDSRATQLAMQLHETNTHRQKASQAMYLAAREQVEKKSSDKILVAVGDGWGAGLVGLVAGKLNHEFHKPVLVVGKDADRYVGSGRSIEGFDITRALHAAAAYLDKFGGHPQACGFSTTGVERFEQAISTMQFFAEQNIDDDLLLPSTKIDAQITFEEIDWELYDSLAQLRPFGTGNPEPKFVSRGVRVVAMSVVGADGKHLRLRVGSPNGRMMQAIGFGLGSHCASLTLGQPIDLLFTIDVNEWNGNREQQLRVIDIDFQTK